MNRSVVAVLLLAASLTPSGWAQTPTPADPLDASVPVPAAAYVSSFSTYRGFTEQDIASWRESNDTVGRIGGWRVYAREVEEARKREGTGEGTRHSPPSTTAPAGPPTGRGHSHGGRHD